MFKVLESPRNCFFFYYSFSGFLAFSCFLLIHYINISISIQYKMPSERCSDGIFNASNQLVPTLIFCHRLTDSFFASVLICGITKPSFISCSFGKMERVFTSSAGIFSRAGLLAGAKRYGDTVFRRDFGVERVVDVFVGIGDVFASAESAKTQSRIPYLSASTLRCRHCFSLLQNALAKFKSPPLPAARQMSPRASSSMMDGLKRLTSGRIDFNTSAAAFKSSGFEPLGSLPK